MNDIVTKSKRTVLLAMTLIMFLASTASTLIITNDTAKSAPPDSLTVNGVECAPRLVRIPTAVVAGAQGEFSNVPSVNVSATYQSNGDNVFGGYNQTSIALPIRWYADPLLSKLNDIDSDDYSEALKADMQDIRSLGDPGKNLNTGGAPLKVEDLDSNNAFAIVFDAKVAGNGDPQKDCRQTPNVLFSRPSKPEEFFGTYLGNETLLIATLDPVQKTIRLGNPSGTKQVFNVSGEASIFSNPLFSDDSTAGFCSDYPSGAAYNVCMQAHVVDFNTILYREERYILQEWKGNQSIRMEYVLDTASSPFDSRKSGLGSCSTKPKFRIDGDNAGKINELTADDNGINGFFGQLTGLGQVSGSQKIQFVEVDLSCNVEDEKDIELYSLQNFLRIAQYFEKDNAVLIIPKNPGDGEKPLAQIYKKSPSDPTLFLVDAGIEADGCTLTEANTSIKFTSDPSALTSDGSYVDAYWTFPNSDSSCSAMGANIKVKFTATDSTETLDAALASGSGSGPPPAASEPEEVCGSGGALGWILCPILTLLDESTQALEDQIQGFLFVDTSRFDKDTPSGRQIYGAWSTFRGLATVIIVIIALMMIFSQAMGEGLFDNYSLKKILPRLIIAGIGIQLSWFMLVELVNIFNILGNGIGGLVLSNFGLERSTNLRDILGGLTSGASGGDIATGALFVGLAIAAPLLMGGIFAIAIGVAASVLVGIITLIVRDMIILLGVITAPIAIAMSVLPGTQKTSKWWWESFEKALMMYPIIMLLLAAGKVVGNLLFKSAKLDNGELSMTYVIAGIIAWYIPYFFLPKALAAGGSALGKITGFAGDKSKGLFGKASSWNDKRVGAKKAWNTKIKDNQLAMQAGSGSKIAAARMRMRSGQPVTGRSFRKSKQDAINKGFLSLQDQAHEANTKDAERILQTDTGAAGVAYRNAGADSTALVSLIQKSTDAAERQAMISRLIALKDDKAMRTLMATPGNATPELIRAINKNEIGPAFGDKAPDIAKATSLDGRTFTVPPMVNKREVGPKTHSWSDETWKQVLVGSDAVTQAHYLDVLKTDPVAASHIDDKKLVAIEAAMGMAPGTLKPQLAKAATSDRRLKRSVNFIGYRHGVKLYSFQYLWSDVTYVGVMAQDLVDTHPEALSKDQFGYYMVNYSILGIEMKTLEEWTKQNSDVRA